MTCHYWLGTTRHKLARLSICIILSSLWHVFSIHSWKIFGYSFYSPEKNPKLNTPLHRVLLGVVRRRQSRWRLGDAEYEGSRAKAVAIPRLQVAKQNGEGASTFLISQKYVSLNLGICVCVLQVQDQNGLIFRKLDVFPFFQGQLEGERPGCNTETF